MIHVLITITVLILVVYRKNLSTLFLFKSFRFKDNQLLYLFILTFIPVILAHSIFPAFVGSSDNEKLVEAKKEKNYFHAVLIYEDMMKMYPDSTSLLFDYIDTHIKYGPSDTTSLVEICYETSSKNIPIYLSYVNLYKDSKLKEVFYLDTTNYIDSSFYNSPYSHYVSALTCLKFGKFAEAEFHLKQEIKKFGYSKRSVNELAELYFNTNQSKLREILKNPLFEKQLSYSDQTKYYFILKDFLSYFATQLSNQYSAANWFAIFTALLISIVWMIYLRSMDIFKPEKWSDIILIFIIGGLCTFLCLPFYEFSSLVLDFHINGEAWNDFLYCVVVIGGSEELVKFLPWFLLLLFKKSFKEPFDYILYASVSALGFACVENWQYLSEIQNTVNRMIIAVVSHMFDASIVAYGFILMTFKYKQYKWRYILPLIGFILAAISHGFYDFWLISDAVDDYKIITYLFFIISLHIWMFFKNNAINHSQFFTTQINLNKNYLLDLLTISILSIWMIEYLISSSFYGTAIANAGIYYKAMIIGLFLIYMSFTIYKVELKFGSWNKFNFLNWNALFLLPFSDNMEDEEFEEIPENLELRFFTSKSNQYIGNLLPISGKIERNIEVDDTRWYLISLNSPLHFQLYHPKHVIIRPKSKNQSLNDDKIEIIFLLIPNGDLLYKKNLSVKDLRYVGTVYSRPI